MKNRLYIERKTEVQTISIVKINSITRDIIYHINRYTWKGFLKDLNKYLLDTDLKIILLHHQNNYVRNWKMMSNAAILIF